MIYIRTYIYYILFINLYLHTFMATATIFRRWWLLLLERKLMQMNTIRPYTQPL